MIRFLLLLLLLNLSAKNTLSQTKETPFEIGIKYYNSGEYILAIAFLGVAIDQDNQNVLAYYHRGMAYLKQGIQIDKAVVDLSEVIRISPFSFVAYANRAAAKIKLGDIEGALADCNFVIDVSEGFDIKNDLLGFAYQNRGQCNRLREKNPEAISDFTKAIQLNYNDANSYMGRGLSNIALGNKKLGCLDFSKAGELGYDAYDAIRLFCK
jgi:tetratricopeptide (TPR) repeat protein